MTSVEKLEKLLKEVINDAAKKLNLDKYSIDFDIKAQIGDGLLGEFFKGSITDLNTDTVIYLAVKKAPTEQIRREQGFIDLIYENEIAFYSKIYPTMKKFEEEHQVPKPFDSVPGYITCNREKGNEIIVMKDITKDGFILRKKDLLFDDEHTKFIFQTYGHFHAISFCLKEQKPQEFAKLVDGLHCIWTKFASDKGFDMNFRSILQKAVKTLNQDTDGPIIEKFMKYVNNPSQVFAEIAAYKGDYFGIIHGDCWSNNVMYKYQDSKTFSKLDAMKLIDFQLVFTGSPVYDLSYFFYTGGCKELFDQLEHYLDIYHASFTKAAEELGCDGNKLLPRDILSQEWKKYAKFGMMLATLIIRMKLISKEATAEFLKKMDHQKENDAQKRQEEVAKISYDEKLYNKRVRDLVVHMYEIDAL